MISEIKSTIVYEIENVFGRKIVSLRDCMELSEEIFAKTQYRLNPNTLRRFFNLVKANYPPSKSTLTILAKYCGFQSINDIYRVKNTENLEEGVLNPDNVLHFLVSLFNEEQMITGEEASYLSMAKNVIKFLNTNKFLTDRFQSMVAKTENGRYFYYEKLVNIDKLNSFYGNGLRYYLMEKGTVDADVFATSLNVFKYWLSGENEKLLKAGQNLLKIEVIEKLPTFTLARQLSGILYYNNVAGLNNELVLADINSAYTKFVSLDESRKELSLFTFIISKALVLVNKYKEALFYIEITKDLLEKEKVDYVDKNQQSIFALLQSYAYFNLGQQKKALKLFTSIKSSDFSFLSRKFSCILYIALLKKIKAKQSHEKNDIQLATMINETGFKRLSNL